MAQNHPPFTEPPPPIDAPNWGKLFQQWWWRKCKHYGVDPIQAFWEMLQPDEGEVEQFLKEYDQGKHPLSEEDQTALKEASVKLFERLPKSTDLRQQLAQAQAATESMRVHCLGLPALQGPVWLSPEEAKRLEAELEEEKAIVDRVWKALGISDYDHAKPFAIDEHVANLKAELTRAHERHDAIAKAHKDIQALVEQNQAELIARLEKAEAELKTAEYLFINRPHPPTEHWLDRVDAFLAARKEQV